MRRFLRYLRIAFSATCLIACILFFALWMRSYWWLDVIKIRPPELQLSASSLKGKFVLEQSSASWHDWELLHPRELTSEEVSKDTYLSAERMEEHYSRLNVKFSHFQ